LKNERISGVSTVKTCSICADFRLLCEKEVYDVAAKWNMSAVDDLTKRIILLPVNCLFRYVCFNVGNSLNVGHYPLLRLYLS